MWWRRWDGDSNVRFPEQGHTEVVGSAESFAAQYEFFTGVAPRTTMVLPEQPGQVEIAGRARSSPTTATSGRGTSTAGSATRSRSPDRPPTVRGTADGRSGWRVLDRA